MPLFRGVCPPGRAAALPAVSGVEAVEVAAGDAALLLGEVRLQRRQQRLADVQVGVAQHAVLEEPEERRTLEDTLVLLPGDPTGRTEMQLRKRVQGIHRPNRGLDSCKSLTSGSRSLRPCCRRRWRRRCSW